MPMRFLVRRATDSAPTSDQAYEGDVLLLGTSTESDVLLPGLRGTIRLTAGKQGVLNFSIKGGHGAFAGRSVNKGQLSTDTQLEVDGYVIQAIDAPGGFDAGLAITGSVDASKLWREQLDFERDTQFAQARLQTRWFSLVAVPRAKSARRANPIDRSVSALDR